MTNPDNIYRVEKTDEKILVKLNGVILITVDSFERQIKGKNILDNLDFENMDTFDYEIAFSKVEKPSPGDIFYNYAWDFFNDFFKAVKEYFGDKKKN